MRNTPARRVPTRGRPRPATGALDALSAADIGSLSTADLLGIARAANPSARAPNTGARAAGPVTGLHTGGSLRGTGLSAFTKWVELVELPPLVGAYAQIKVGDVCRVTQHTPASGQSPALFTLAVDGNSPCSVPATCIMPASTDKIELALQKEINSSASKKVCAPHSLWQRAVWPTPVLYCTGGAALWTSRGWLDGGGGA